MGLSVRLVMSNVVIDLTTPDSSPSEDNSSVLQFVIDGMRCAQIAKKSLISRRTFVETASLTLVNLSDPD